MNLSAFTDELVRLQGGLAVLAKVAGSGNMFVRMPAFGAAAGLGAHGIQHIKAMVTKDPADEPQGDFLGAAAKTGLGGLSIAGLLHLIAKAKAK